MEYLVCNDLSMGLGVCSLGPDRDKVQAEQCSGKCSGEVALPVTIPVCRRLATKGSPNVLDALIRSERFFANFSLALMCVHR